MPFRQSWKPVFVLMTSRVSKSVLSYFTGNTGGPGIYGLSKFSRNFSMFYSFSSVWKLSQGNSYGSLISSEGIVWTWWYGGRNRNRGDLGNNVTREEEHGPWMFIDWKLILIHYWPLLKKFVINLVMKFLG